MNAKVEEQNPEMVTIEVDGVEMQAPKGSMLIEATDKAGIDVPRFCYHRKLSIAANCRMCLVDVERAPKPLPACATPVADGMKVHTASPRARAAQKGVMEFLLINHPLDCPICDQGGECELQDLSLGYGRSVSRFTERKRVVRDENLGPLISTDMTRCIHCTRCVRFLDEIAGTKELGGMGRGEHMEIGTYVQRGVHSELSGNVIDLCPVGALTDKPFRFTARAWELLSHPGIAPHDCVGSNVYMHHRRGRIMRVVPRDNEQVNETWIADRDRYSHFAVYGEDRLAAPMIKQDGEWVEVDWEVALDAATRGLRGVVGGDGADQLAALVSPTATLEEMFLLGRLVRGLGSRNIDHRVRQADFSDQSGAPLFPYLGQPIEDLERTDAALVVGSYLRWDQPLLNHRLRKAARAGAPVMFLNPRAFDFNFQPAEELVAAPQALVPELAAVAKALAEQTGQQPEGLDALLNGLTPGDAHRRIAERLAGAERGTVLLGSLVEAHPDGAVLRALGALVAALANAAYGVLSHGPNGAGGHLAGALPHRDAGGRDEAQPGLDARAMFATPRKGYLLFNVEAEYDCWDGAEAVEALQAADCVVVMTPFVSERMKAYADVLLPIGAFGETAGTFVNCEGRWQSFSGVGRPVGEARPAWRVLRVLGNLLDLEGFDYNAPDDVYAAVREAAGPEILPEAPEWHAPSWQATQLGALVRMGGMPIYAVDAVVRRAEALQQTVQARDAGVYVSAETASELGVEDGETVRVTQSGRSRALPLMVDDGIPAGSAWIPAGLPASAGLGPSCGEVTLEPGA